MISITVTLSRRCELKMTYIMKVITRKLMLLKRPTRLLMNSKSEEARLHNLASRLNSLERSTLLNKDRSSGEVIKFT